MSPSIVGPALGLMLLAAMACAAGGSTDDPGASESSQALALDLERPRTDVSVGGPALAGDDGGRWMLHLDAIDFGRRGRFYEVYLDLPADTDPDPDGPSYLGNLAHFGPVDELSSVAFDVTESLGQWQARRTDGTLRLTFVERGVLGTEPATDEPGRPVHVGSLRFERQP